MYPFVEKVTPETVHRKETLQIQRDIRRIQKQALVFSAIATVVSIISIFISILVLTGVIG